MGVSISGLLIKENIKDNLTDFENCFKKVYPNFKLEFEKEIVLGSMSERKRGSNYIDFYFTNSGTYLTFDENALDGTYWLYELSEISEILNFDICETSMSFGFSKYLQKKEIASFNIFNSQKHGDDFLNISVNIDIYWDVLPRITMDYIGENIHEIDQSLKCFRYKILLGKTQSQINEERIREEYKRRDEKKRDDELKQIENTEKKTKPNKKGFWNWLIK